MPEEIIIEGMEELAFRRSIEIMLRNGRADEAVARLKALLPECAGEGKTLPARLLDLEPCDIKLGGWDKLEAKIAEYSRPMIPITAIGIGIADPADDGLEPDAMGNLRPPLQTSYYSDATFPFSETDRADLLEGYSAFGCEWQGDYDRIDDTLSIEGIDDLYGAIARLENDVAASDRPDTDKVRAGAIGACYLGVMVWQAARRAVIEQGLPRPMAVLLVNSDAYPFFDAPVMTCDEYLDDGALQVVHHASAASSDEFDSEESDVASLVGLTGLGAHRETTKKMALVLDGLEAHDPIGMADDLVAQAAFDPTSVDVSRFMPDASEFRNEPDDDLDAEIPNEAEAEAEHEPEVAFAAELDFQNSQTIFEEPMIPVDALPVDLPHGDLLEEPASDAPAKAEDSAAMSDFAANVPEPVEACEAAALEDYFDDTPTVPSAWRDWIDPETVLAEPSPPSGNETGATKPVTAADAWRDPETLLPYSPQAASASPRSQPASHSIRARIRSSPVAEEVETEKPGLFASLLRLIRRNRA